MRVALPGASQVASDNSGRITKLGRMLRRTKFDELPQLWNVVRGDMSLVGPRPELPQFVKHYTSAFDRLLHVRPGLTDDASIAFRNEEGILRGHQDAEQIYIRVLLPAKATRSLAAIERASFVSDVAVLFRTMAALLGWRIGTEQLTLSTLRSQDGHGAADAGEHISPMERKPVLEPQRSLDER